MVLRSDDELSGRCPLNPDEIMKVLELCLRSTLFTFRGVLYRQTEGIAMGSPVSSLVTNLFMHSLETNAIMRRSSAPRLLIRYVNETFVIIRRRLLNEPFHFINTMSETIKFSKEVESDKNELAFLYCLVKRKLDGKFEINIFKKPTNSDRYPFRIKVTVAKNLINRAKRIVTEVEEINSRELKLVQSTLQSNNYPKDYIYRYL
ncbi:unnamed protein product [Trichobilharzia regenti]|nr:unnamed protein product [Trichobilharzia regenti]